MNQQNFDGLPEPKVYNLQTATDFMAKIKKVKNIIKEKEEVAIKRISILQDEIKQVTEWLKEEIEPDESKIKYFETELLRYWNEQHDKNEKFKLSTPYGKIKTRKQQLQWEYDEEKLKNWLLKNNPNLITKKQTETINKAEFKKKFDVLSDGTVVNPDTGEIAEGVTAKEQPIKIEIEVK